MRKSIKYSIQPEALGWKEWAMNGFINMQDVYNNYVGKGGVRVYEAHEVK